MRAFTLMMEFQGFHNSKFIAWRKLDWKAWVDLLFFDVLFLFMIYRDTIT